MGMGVYGIAWETKDGNNVLIVSAIFVFPVLVSDALELVFMANKKRTYVTGTQKR